MADAIRVRSREVPVIRVRTRQRSVADQAESRYGDLSLIVWDIWARSRTHRGLFTADRMTHGATAVEAKATFERANPDYEVLTITP